MTGENSFDASTLAGVRVLIVDDEPVLAQTFRIVLQLAGAACVCAGHGSEALDVLDREQFDVIVCDRQMPVMTGPALIRELRRRGNTTPTLLFVNSLDDEGERLREELRLAGTLSKPLQPAELIAAIRKACDGEPLYSTAAHRTEAGLHGRWDGDTEPSQHACQFALCNSDGRQQ